MHKQAEHMKYPETKPQTRGECLQMPRPCPFVSCRYHIYLEIVRGGLRIVRAYEGEEVEDVLEGMAYTCALDAAEEGGMTLEKIGQVFGVSRERVRQIEAKSLKSLLQAQLDLRDLWEDMDSSGEAIHVLHVEVGK